MRACVRACVCTWYFVYSLDWTGHVTQNGGSMVELELVLWQGLNNHIRLSTSILHTVTTLIASAFSSTRLNGYTYIERAERRRWATASDTAVTTG